MKYKNQISQHLFIFALFFALLTLVLPTVKAAGNHLDYSFSGDGKALLNFGVNTLDQVRDVAVLPSGKIVVVGTTVLNDNIDLAIARFNADGSLDTTFDGDGKATSSFGGNEYGSAVVVQPDGKYVVAGYSLLNNNFRFMVTRFNTNGSPDTTFNGSGTIFHDFSSGIDQAFDAAIQPDGKIVVVGRVQISGLDYKWGGIRLNANGTLDTSFTTMEFNFGAGGDEARSVDILPDGKIIVAGFISSPSGDSGSFAVVRFNSNGTIDTTFSFVNFFGEKDEAYKIQRLADGKFIVAGKCRSVANLDAIALVRYNANGTLDTTFGSSGKVVTDLSSLNEVAHDFIIQPDGKIVVAGEAYGNPAKTFVLARYLANGNPDTTFGSGGRVKTVFGNGYSEARAIAFHDSSLFEDKIIVAGSHFTGSPITAAGFAVSRYRLGGTAGVADFSDDRQADYAVFRQGVWWTANSATGATTGLQWGTTNDIPVPGDYDRDGKTDAAIYRPSTNEWYILRSSNNSYFSGVFGTSGDKPVQADYDGDGFTDIAVFRPSNGIWYVLRTSDNVTSLTQFGIAEDKPVQADFDGDSLTDFAVFRPSDRTWYILNSVANDVTIAQFGLSADRPTPADYDGDGKADIAVFRPSTNVWFVLNSLTGGLRAVRWGAAGDIAAPADFDSDGKADVTIFRPSTGTWYVLNSTTGNFQTYNFGLAGDIPISSAYIPQ